MDERIEDFLENLKKGRDIDFIKESGWRFSKDQLIKIISELFYTAYQEETDDGCLPEEEQKQNYKGFINRFINNMNEYEDGFFIDFEKIADNISQEAYDASADGYNYAYYYNGEGSEFMDRIVDELNECDIVLEANIEEDESGAQFLDITFCSEDLEDGDCNGNILFKQDENERWVRRTEAELEEYRKENA